MPVAMQGTLLVFPCKTGGFCFALLVKFGEEKRQFKNRSIQIMFSSCSWKRRFSSCWHTNLKLFENKNNIFYSSFKCLCAIKDVVSFWRWGMMTKIFRWAVIHSAGGRQDSASSSPWGFGPILSTWMIHELFSQILDRVSHNTTQRFRLLMWIGKSHFPLTDHSFSWLFCSLSIWEQQVSNFPNQKPSGRQASELTLSSMRFSYFCVSWWMPQRYEHLCEVLRAVLYWQWARQSSIVTRGSEEESNYDSGYGRMSKLSQRREFTYTSACKQQATGVPRPMQSRLQMPLCSTAVRGVVPTRPPHCFCQPEPGAEARPTGRD